VGFGRFDARALPTATAAFVDFLKANRRVPDDASWRWRGHAYLVASAPSRKAIDDGVMLVGDAAGLADPRSGEGIRPAIESGLMAASAILGAAGEYGRARLSSYAEQLRSTYGVGRAARGLSRVVPDRSASALGRYLMRNPWFARHVLLDRWFLHRH
jgi:flavin-dependent dehydrogenase